MGSMARQVTAVAAFVLPMIHRLNQQMADLLQFLLKINERV